MSIIRSIRGSLIILSFAGLNCRSHRGTDTSATWPDRYLVVLGIAQDGGHPQAGCELDCCKDIWSDKGAGHAVTCLLLVDRPSASWWLIEATPDLPRQLHEARRYLPQGAGRLPNGIFITHAHTGHYTGLMHLGREAMGAHDIPVWVMPRMDSFLRTSGPWRQLVELGNIRIARLQDDSLRPLNGAIGIRPFRVPHRDEYSETVGFRIGTADRSVLFIPDIDKWERWSRDIRAEVSAVSLALLDGTFFRNGELRGRDMKEVPHPFIEETMALFSNAPDSLRQRVHFIHLNHTNPLLREGPSADSLRSRGFGLAAEGMIIPL
ncbi:MAG: hypothetical protein RJA57_371 [Bacteroidota bacterium]|jgi:pyrroloquinoline quinone biosynthesis protein B